MQIENKFIGGRVTNVKQIDRNGIPVGIVEGYIATWDLDRGDIWGVRDQFVKGAFAKSLSDLRQRKRQIRLKDHHGRTIGGFPIETAKEDDIGLFSIGEINLEVQQGREAYSLAKQGVLSDFSVGFSIEKSTRDEQNDVRTIQEAIIWEGSIVDEPMNPFANITAVKGLSDKVAFELGIKEEELIDVIKKFNCFDKITDEQFTKMTPKDIEDALKKTGVFSRNVCKTIASKFNEQEEVVEEQIEEDSDQEEMKNIYSELVNIKGLFSKSTQCDAG